MLRTLLTLLVSQPYQVPPRPPEVRTEDPFRRQLGQRLDRGNRFGTSSVDAGSPYAFGEFAPPDGTGVGTACAGVDVTGAAGEVVTFARTGTATCLTGATLTNIQNSTMSSIATGKPRVMPGGDGSGGNGILVEMARTNSCLRSQEMDNAAWSNIVAGAASAPTLNAANAAVMPDGTTTAEEYTFPATTILQLSGRFQEPAACDSAACAISIMVKGIDGAGTMDLCAFSSGVTCTACAYVTTGWNRCWVQGSTGNAGLFIGNDSRDNGLVIRGSTHVYLGMAQMEVGTGATSYISTTSAAVTRNAETASMPIASTSLVSLGYTYVTPTAYIATPVPVEWKIDSNNTMDGWITSTPAYNGRELIASAAKTAITTATAPVNSSLRISYDWSGTVATSCINAVCTTATPSAATAAVGASTLYIGTYSSGAFQSNGVIKRVCVSPTLTRCD